MPACAELARSDRSLGPSSVDWLSCLHQLAVSFPDCKSRLGSRKLCESATPPFLSQTLSPKPAIRKPSGFEATQLFESATFVICESQALSLQYFSRIRSRQSVSKASTASPTPSPNPVSVRLCDYVSRWHCGISNIRVFKLQ